MIGEQFFVVETFEDMARESFKESLEKSMSDFRFITMSPYSNYVEPLHEEDVLLTDYQHSVKFEEIKLQFKTRKKLYLD